MDVNRLSLGERIAGAAALALLVFMFFPWFGIGGENESAFKIFSYIDEVLIVTVAITLLLVGVRANGMSTGDIPVGTLILALGGLSTLLILYRIINPIDVGGTDLDRKLGLFLGLIASGAVAVGGWMALRGVTSIEGARDELSDTFGGEGEGRSSRRRPPRERASGETAAPFPGDETAGQPPPERREPPSGPPPG